MENFRQRLSQNAQLYPDLADLGPKSQPSNAHAKKNEPIVISDSESDISQGRTVLKPTSGLPKQRSTSEQHSSLYFNKVHPLGGDYTSIPIAVPFNPPRIHSVAQPANSGAGHEETLDVPDFPEDYTSLSPQEAEKALRELMEGSNEEYSSMEVDMSEAIVPGFKDDIRLLPHQISGRKFMKEREDPKSKKFGGILADDMGLGKTIQTLTRIVEGRPKKSDNAEGWDAPTLVICPLALVEQWAEETKKMTRNQFVIKHHGSGRTPDPNVLRRSNIVITTYDVVKSEYRVFDPAAAESKKAKKQTTQDSDGSDEFDYKVSKAKSTSNSKCALFKVKWWRIVLDEAHNIKNKTTLGALACCALEAKFRWCLTGTPMQNDVTELYSLIKFLRIKPFSDWERFNNQIAKPVKSGKGANRAMKRLQVVLKRIMLRRRKDETLNGKAILDLPGRNVDIVSCLFSDSERIFYHSLETQMESTIATLLGSKKANYISVLLLLLRLRQACNHPCLITKDYTEDAEAIDPKAAKSQTQATDVDADDLAAAFGQLAVVRKCKMCTIDLSPANSEPEGSHCKACTALAARAKEQERSRPISAKIRMVLKLVNDIERRSNGEEKTIIFSQFTSMLDLLEPFLFENDTRFVRYDGKMSAADREVALKKIRNDNRIKVILISFKAGSTGLNLTACNNVILVDMWWNPALEDQAFDRAHRLGQTRDVNIFKLKVDGTVEDRILELQEKKRELAKAALSGDKISSMRLGMEDLLALFRPGAHDDDDD